MSETPLEETADRQRRTIEESQQLFARTAELPFQQLVDLQLSTARALMSGLELTNAAQRMSLDVTRSMVGSYVDALEGSTPGETQRGGQQQGSRMQGGPYQPAQSRGQPQQQPTEFPGQSRQQMQPPQQAQTGGQMQPPQQPPTQQMQPPGQGTGQPPTQQTTQRPAPPPSEAPPGEERRDEQLPRGPM